MNDAMLIGVVREALRVGLLMVAGPLLAALLAGLLVSLGQAMTQMNEPTVGLVGRMVAVALASAMLLPWLMLQWLDYATASFGGFPELL